jgi:hypothetical protein
MADELPPDEPETPQDVPDEPEAPAEGAEPAKMSQQEANYREGNPQRSCGLCGHFDSKGHSCDVVDGEISPFGFSNLFLRQDNPFREGEKEAFKGGTRVVPAPAAMPVGPPEPGLLQIGGKMYG